MGGVISTITREKVAAPRIKAVTEISSSSMTVEWMQAENGRSLQVVTKTKQGSATWERRSQENSTTVNCDLVAEEAYNVSAVFTGSWLACVESSPVCVVADLEKPFQNIPRTAEVSSDIFLIPVERPAKILLFGEIGSGKSSLYNAFLALFNKSGVLGVQVTRIGKATEQAESVTKKLVWKPAIAGTGVSIWDSAGWKEEGIPRIVATDYNKRFLQKLIAGHYLSGYELVPPFQDSGEFYNPNPKPEDQFRIIVLTFSCKNIGYLPLEPDPRKRVTFHGKSKDHLLRISNDLQSCEKVSGGEIRIFLALTKADCLLCTSTAIRTTQIGHINATRTSDVRDIFHKRVARDVRDYFAQHFQSTQIVFTAGYVSDTIHREDLDALNCHAFNAIIRACF